jgi:hypothetical protein
VVKRAEQQVRPRVHAQTRPTGTRRGQADGVEEKGQSLPPPLDESAFFHNRTVKK